MAQRYPAWPLVWIVVGKGEVRAYAHTDEPATTKAMRRNTGGDFSRIAASLWGSGGSVEEADSPPER